MASFDSKTVEELQSMVPEVKGQWVVYVLRSIPRPMRTYAGVTNDLPKRIRQHNGELAGGARATSTTRPWKLHAIVRGFGSDKSAAMRFEWFTKVKHYISSSSSSKSVPGGSGIARREFLLGYALSKCKLSADNLRICVAIRGGENVTTTKEQKEDIAGVEQQQHCLSVVLEEENVCPKSDG